MTINSLITGLKSLRDQQKQLKKNDIKGYNSLSASLEGLLLDAKNYLQRTYPDDKEYVKDFEEKSEGDSLTAPRWEGIISSLTIIKEKGHPCNIDLDELIEEWKDLQLNMQTTQEKLENSFKPTNPNFTGCPISVYEDYDIYGNFFKQYELLKLRTSNLLHKTYKDDVKLLERFDESNNKLSANGIVNVIEQLQQISQYCKPADANIVATQYNNSTVYNDCKFDVVINNTLKEVLNENQFDELMALLSQKVPQNDKRRKVQEWFSGLGQSVASSLITAFITNSGLI